MDSKTIILCVVFFAIFFISYIVTFYMQTIDLKTKTKNAMVQHPDSDSLNYISEQLTILLIVNSLLIFGIPILIGGIYLFYRHIHKDSSKETFTNGIIITLLVCLFGFLLFTLSYSSYIWSTVESKITNTDVQKNFKDANPNIGALIALPAVLLFLFVAFFIYYFYDVHFDNDDHSPGKIDEISNDEPEEVKPISAGSSGDSNSSGTSQTQSKIQMS